MFKLTSVLAKATMVMLIVLGLFFVACDKKEKKKEKSESAEIGSEVGDIAPDFTLSSLSDEMINLKDFRGKVVLLNVWEST